MRTVTGKWEASEQALPAGSIIVPMDQPLARLAFLLFEPRSDDGLMAWNILDAVLARRRRLSSTRSCGPWTPSPNKKSGTESYSA